MEENIINLCTAVIDTMAEQQGSPGFQADHTTSSRPDVDPDNMDIDHEMRSEWEYVQYQHDHTKALNHRRLQSGTTDEEWHDCISTQGVSELAEHPNATYSMCLFMIAHCEAPSLFSHSCKEHKTDFFSR